MSRFALLLLAVCQNVLAFKNPACSSGLYKQLGKYSTIAPVSSFCYSKYPPKTETSVVTATTTSTTTSTQTITATTDTTTFATQTAVTTVTVTISAPVKAKRHDEHNVKRNKTPVTPKPVKPKPCPELVILQALASKVVATACSCILSTPTVTSTTTKILTAATKATTTTVVTNIITSTTTTTSTATATATAAPAPYPLPPTCNTPSALGCSTAIACNGGNSASCICEQTTEGRNACIEESNISCGAACSSSAECGDGYSCVTSTCCGPAVCIRTGVSLGNTCTSVAAKMVRVLRGLEKRAIVGLPLHLPPSSA